MEGANFSAKPPETLYKYTSFCCARKTLESGEIYFANSRKFNDPFDGRFSADLESREAIEKLANLYEQKVILPHRYKRNFPSIWEKWERKKQELMSNPDAYAEEMRKMWAAKETRGFCCLTESSKSLPMWAHYADNHTGCCLAFDLSKYGKGGEEAVFPFSYLKQIEYCDELPMVSADKVPYFYGYKSREWAYEKEWRAVMFNATMLSSEIRASSLGKKCKGAGCYSLGTNLLRGVILGYQIKKRDNQDIVRIACQKRITVWQAEPELYKYGMRMTKISDGWWNGL